YLAMATLGFTLIVQEMLLQLSVITHGSEGMKVQPASILGLTFHTDYRKYYLLFVVTVAMLLFARNLVKGRAGRAFLAIRDNERAAAAMGVNIARYKTIAFAISALYTGLAGALSAFIVGFLDPQEFSFFLSIQFITIIILGGLASLLGSLLGAAFLVILPELLAGLDVWQALVYGLIMVVTIIFMPFGLSGAIRRYGYRWFGTAGDGKGHARAGRHRRTREARRRVHRSHDQRPRRRAAGRLAADGARRAPARRAARRRPRGRARRSGHVVRRRRRGRAATGEA